MVTIEIPGAGDIVFTVTVDRGMWKCSEGFVQRAVEVMAKVWKMQDKRVYDPDPDYHAAEFVAKKLGGKIVAADKAEGVAGAIY